MPSKWVKKQTGREKNADSLRLPAQLQDELAQFGGGDSSLNRRRDLGPSRKERRKQERKHRKQGQSKQWRVSPPEDALSSSAIADGRDARPAGRRSSLIARQTQPLKPPVSGRGPGSVERSQRRLPEPKRAHADTTASKHASGTKRKLPSFLEEEDAHDMHIAMLEKRLGIRSGAKVAGKDARAEKRLKQELKADGLGFLDRFESVTSAQQLKKGSASELKRASSSNGKGAHADAGAIVRRKPTALQKLAAAAESSEESAGEDWEQDASVGAEESDFSGEDSRSDVSDLGALDQIGSDGSEAGDGELADPEGSDSGSGSETDIALLDGHDPGEGREDSAEGGAAAGAAVRAAAEAGEAKRYVPPALRGADTAEAARRRQLRGLLNRLSEGNLASIAAQLAELLNSGRQRLMVDELVRAVLGSCISDEQALASLALINAAIVRAVSLAVGPHVTALFVEALVLRFEDDYSQLKDHACCNAALLLAHLYNFGAVHCTLIYELVRRMILKAHESDVAASASGELELSVLLKLLGAVGTQLRSDDPAALVEMIKLHQSNAATTDQRELLSSSSAPGENTSTRKRVFNQMLIELKNNKLKASGVDTGAQSRLQKVMRKLASDSKAPALKAGWQELLHAEERGRWWIVGSAWAGRPVGPGSDAELREVASPARAGGSEVRAGGAATEEARLLSLAAEQRLSTEVRKAVFVAIMGSDDYIHAFDRISKLKVKKAQKAEVVRVLMHCCGAEATFNAFYALLAARLCSAHREYKFAFHFAMWDAFKQLHDAPLNKVANTAKLLAQLLNRGALPVTVLKVVRWHDLDQRALFFWQVCFCELLNASTDVMTRTMLPLGSDGPAELRDGVLLFIKRDLERLVRRTRKDLFPALSHLLRILSPSSGGM